MGNVKENLSRKHYIERIRKLSGVNQIQQKLLYKLSCRDLREVIFIIESAQMKAIDSYKEIKKEVYE